MKSRKAVLYLVSGLSGHTRSELGVLAKDTAATFDLEFDRILVAPDPNSESLRSALEWIRFHDTDCMLVPTLRHLPGRDVAPVLRLCDLITLFPLGSYARRIPVGAR
ncbi:hypothetical protein [Nocardia sp. CY41]|uniref:hypothetical protein n=1 Tax=Nocardia sp. CY41 TaxID=2608686 RepID=UPI00135B8C3B|nr:hypothetical protein [Nocardia sp. CY41]